MRHHISPTSDVMCIFRELLGNKIDAYTLPPPVFVAMQGQFLDVDLDAGRLSARRHIIHGLLGIDVTRARRFLRDLFYWALRQNPHWMKRFAGTTVVTAVGMFGRGPGWGLGFLPLHTLGLTVGGIGEKLAMIDGEISCRETLCVTISVDHDAVDGAPAARFVQRFRELVEGAYGLEEDL